MLRKNAIAYVFKLDSRTPFYDTFSVDKDNEINLMQIDARSRCFFSRQTRKLSVHVLLSRSCAAMMMDTSDALVTHYDWSTQ